MVFICVVIMSLVANKDEFTQFSGGKPSAHIPQGARDTSEVYIPPVTALAPINFSMYGVPTDATTMVPPRFDGMAPAIGASAVTARTGTGAGSCDLPECQDDEVE